MRSLLKQKLADRFPHLDFDVLVPPNGKMGDYSTNLAFVLAKKENLPAQAGKDPMEVGEELASGLSRDKDLAGIFEKIETVKPGFINFYLNDSFLRKKLNEIGKDKGYGYNETMKGKTVMVEYTDPNPFKLFHIGHLMSNIIGETISRLYEASGAKVLRANYQGDIGLHVAKAVWGMIQGSQNMPEESDSLEKKAEFLGSVYVSGAHAYESPEFKEKIEEINDKIYKKDDPRINELYEKGKRWSLEYFETIYKKLGTKFDRYFFESETGGDGLKIVNENKKIFNESEDATVFKGEEYGLHTRVFINSKGLPTYEAKELGLNKNKFELYSPDLSIIVTGNEINDYFRVLLKVMELTMPEVAAKTKHVSHGMLRLPSGKMSSRTGDVITADSLIEQTKAKLPESAASLERASLSETKRENEEAREKIAIGAIKYSILKQSPGHDIVFDFEKSLSVKGDSAPYLQYTYARLFNILKKSEQADFQFSIFNFQLLKHELELKLIKKLLTFPDCVLESGEEIAPQHLALYLYELSNDANRFYELVHVLDDENFERLNARLMLVKTVASVLKKGLSLLGVDVLERI